jgi:hypothetical protein
MPGADFLAARQSHYANILNPLFDPTPHMNSIRMFEFVWSLVRAGGLELGGFDPWYESKAIIDDMRNLAGLELAQKRPSTTTPPRPPARPRPPRTKSSCALWPAPSMACRPNSAKPGGTL